MTIASNTSTSGGVRVEAFPRDFVWGVATAAYQIEGATAEGGRGPSIWDTFAKSGHTHNGDSGDIACDHYHRWESDLDLMAGLGIPAYRLSLSWSRLQPEGRGPLNSEAVDFYRNLLTGLRKRGIDAWVTLYHWDLPQPLEDAGGWPARDTAERFGEYVSLVVAELGDFAGNWITLNEPWCSAFLGYGVGVHAPGRASLEDFVAASHHLNLAHGLALAAIRRINPTLQVGITNIVSDIEPLTAEPQDVSAASRLDAANNKLFLDPTYRGSYSTAVHDIYNKYGLSGVIRPGDLELISAPTDFVGINHYQRVLVWEDPDAGFLSVGERPAEPASTSFGWSVVPDSLSSVLKRVAADYTQLPIVITENGASYDDYVDPNGNVLDQERVDYFDGYLSAAAEAIEAGVNLRGYFAWSFLDNYEWAEGYSKRFGLVFVDYATQSRTPKLSAKWYSKLIARHSDESRSEVNPT